MQKKIFVNFSIVSFSIILVLSFLIVLATYGDLLTITRTDLTTQAEYFAVGYLNMGIEYLEQVGEITKVRVTLIDDIGTVLFDSQADVTTTLNHSNREEFIQAQAKGFGESRRHSDTIQKLTYYYAILLDNNYVLRVSIATNSLIGMYDKTSSFIVFIIIANIFLSMYISKKVTKNIIKPINQINLESPLDNDVYNELSPLLTKMHKQKHMIDIQIKEIKNQNYEFNFITETMSEALIVFSSDKHILSANKFSQLLFSNTDAVGKSYLEFSRNIDYIKILESAFSGKSAEAKYYFENKCYLLTATPVLSKGGRLAVVMLGCDITEREENEQIRRDFSANVSHELKTPLTSIIGFSDIMLNGIAKQEDFNHFIEKINDEARRLLTLIEDIIRLSSLDADNIKREFSKVDLLDTINSAVDKLEFKAKKKGVTFHILGQHACINGVEHSLYELVFNLCDNAISYNNDNGEIFVSTHVEEGQVVLSVKDTGIGIPSSEQDSVFERFYRVDKSHSKDTGGTGLGLSIVKHIAILHDAKINIDSQEGTGTTITVTFPVE